MRSIFLGLAMALVVTMSATQMASAASSEAEAAKAIAKELEQSGLLKDYRIAVKYNDGVAWLSGSVVSVQQEAAAKLVASQCQGVRQVISNLQVGDGQANSSSQSVSNALQNSPAKQEVKTEQSDGLKQALANTLDENLGNTVKTSHANKVNEPQPLANNLQAQQTAAMQRRMTPRSNMPVPYAQAGRGVQQMGYAQPASYCPGGCPPGGGMHGGGMAGAGMGSAGMAGGGYGPAAMGRAVSYDNPQMPGYAWPSYAASPNYAALTYPQQYSASAWPYIGPFYPYPQVPLGWRKVTLEWDDGWWFLDFKDCKHCK